MFQLKRTDSSDKDFIALVRLLDAHVSIKDGDMAPYYAQFNKIEMIKYVVVAYDGDKAVGCGSIKAFDSTSMEVKRMYTRPEVRGKGVASMILKELEDWILELGLERSVLETGKEFTEAVHLYTKWGYQRIPNYGQYIGIASSVCFEKML